MAERPTPNPYGTGERKDSNQEEVRSSQQPGSQNNPAPPGTKTPHETP